MIIVIAVVITLIQLIVRSSSVFSKSWGAVTDVTYGLRTVFG